VRRGSLDDLETLRDEAAAADGVVHLAFKHEAAFAGDFGAAVAADVTAIEAFGGALAGTGKPLVMASGVAALPPGVLNTEDDRPASGEGFAVRHRAEDAALALAREGVRSASVRLSPTVHGEGDGGFVGMLTQIARDHGAAGYLGDGRNRWPAVHRHDAATLFRLALERGEPGSVFHGVAEEGVELGAIAEAIGRSLGVPAVRVAAEEAEARFGWLAAVVGLDVRASSERTRERLGWTPTHPRLLEDLEAGRYARAAAAA
jgi:nucleoside-diphosphate-sugar epimerase